MATDSHDYQEQVNLPLDDLDMRTTEGNNNNNNNNNTNPVRFSVRYYLSYNLFNGGIIISYRGLRRIEFVFLIKAILSLILLIYVHIHLSQMPANYLDHLKDLWPRNGILRVEIIPSSQSSHAEQTDAFNEWFTLENSYKREYKLKRMYEREETAALFNRFTKTNSPENKGDVDIESSSEELVDNTFRETNPKPNLFNYLSFKNYIYFEDEKKEMFGSTTKMNRHTTSKSNFSIVEDSAQFCSTKLFYPNSSIRGVLLSSLQSTSNKLPLIDDHELLFHENYIVEYSLEPEFLLMSPSARNRAGIPVMLVGLECTRDKYFGDLVDQFFLKYFLGYNELLKSSVISLSKKEQSKGTFRNVITEEYYSVDSVVINSKDRMLYIRSFFIMVKFTVLISMILKGQAVVINSWLNEMRDQFIGWLTFTAVAARLIIFIVPALGISWGIMFDTMSVFFNDDETHYYITLIIWVADTYHTKFSRCPITKRHWPRFFYLYHFLFYAYRNRFDGRLNNLALYCSWSFTEHSMYYFYLHYECPYALQRVRPQ